ncbi:MAG: acyltransferase [Akkermansia sp.]|nr:acyltransferase [Akkermansia sp.]
METSPRHGTQNTPAAPRIEWVDILKGLAILLVVVGHMEYAEGTSNPGRMLIYSFHMPLFFMLAGYTAALSFSRNGNLQKFVGRRFLSVMVPYICWMLALPCIYVTTGQISHYNLHGACLSLLSGWGQWWFLPCLFILQLMFAAYQLLRRAVPGVYGAVAGFIILLACEFSVNHYAGHLFSNPDFKIHYVLNTYRMFPAFALGVALFEFPAMKRLVVHGRVVPLLAIVLFALLCRDYAHFHVPYGRMLTGLAGCVIMLRLFNGISCVQTQAANIGGMVLRQFKRFGKSSMAIYVLSYLLIPGKPLFPDASVPQLAVFCGNLLLALVICYACVGLKAVINLSPFLSAAFLGEFPKRKKVGDAAASN